NAEINKLIMDNIHDITDFLLSKYDPIYGVAGGYALSSIVATCGYPAAEIILSKIGNILDSHNQTIHEFTETDIAIFNTPEGQVYRDVTKEEYNPMLNEIRARMSKSQLRAVR